MRRIPPRLTKKELNDDPPISIDPVRKFIRMNEWHLDMFNKTCFALENVITDKKVTIIHCNLWGEVCFTYLYAMYSYLMKGHISPWGGEDQERAWNFLKSRTQMLMALLTNLNNWDETEITERIMGYKITIHPRDTGVFISIIRPGEDFPKWLKYEISRHVEPTLPFQRDPTISFNWTFMFDRFSVLEKVRVLANKLERIGAVIAEFDKPKCMKDADILNIMMKPTCLYEEYSRIVANEETPKELKHRIEKIILEHNRLQKKSS